MGSAAGALQVAALRTGLAVEAYQEQLAAGLKWCVGHKAWHPRSDFGADRSRSDGLAARCRTAARDHHQAGYVPKERPPRGRRFQAARDGDKLQARRRVNHLVDVGLLPRPDTLACLDCGHLSDDRRHEYDHARGYDAAHHEDVEPVCSACHHKREAARR